MSFRSSSSEPCRRQGESRRRQRGKRMGLNNFKNNQRVLDSAPSAPRSNNNESGVSIIGIVAVTFILSLLGVVAVSVLTTSSSLSTDYMQAQQAFYIAEAGRQWYIEQIQVDSDWSNNASSGNKGPEDFAGGSFLITIPKCSSNSIDVISTATITGYENQAVKRAVSCSVERSIPDAFNYALYVGGSIHSQNTEDFIVNGQQIENTSVLPTVDFTYYQSIANNVISGDKTFTSGAYSGVWYVDGNVTVDSNVTINGTIIATGNIDMKSKSNIVINASSPYPALVANGNFQFQDSLNITVNGLIYVGADLSGNFLMQKAENINFTGTVMVAGNFNIQNSEDVTITYDPAVVVSLPPGFSGGSTSVVLSVWKEVI